MSFNFTVQSPVGVLTPTLAAAKAVNNAFGNYTEALRYLSVFDHSAFVAIAAAGVGKKPADVEQAVYDAGLDALVEPLTVFVKSLLRGGKDPAAIDEKEPASGEA